jgi:hypothetical protein
MFNKLKSFFLELPNNGRNKFRTMSKNVEKKIELVSLI